MLCIVCGCGLPRRSGAAAAALVFLCAGVSLVAAPRAFLHRETPRVSLKLARWIDAELDPARSAVLVTPDVAWLGLYFARATPSLVCESREPDELLARARALTERGLAVYATAPAPQAPGDWTPVARACRGDLIDTRAPDEIWLFFYAPGGVVAAPPECL